MTTFEFFKKQYDENKNYARKCINPEIETDTLHFVEVATKCAFGGAYNLNTKVDDLEEMREQKLIGYREYSSWEARQLGRTKFYFLTVKGVKAFYKAMFKEG